jgi:hypothetical protein
MREFPIIDAADQQFTAILGGRRATIRLRYNVTVNRWMMDLAIDDAWILTGRRLVLNRDVLEAFDFGIGAIFVHSFTPGAEPGRKELPGGIVRMYHATEADIAAAKAF